MYFWQRIAENCDQNIDPWDRCYDFKNIFAKKKISEKLAFMTRNKAA
jgi:hypothetical protein